MNPFVQFLALYLCAAGAAVAAPAAPVAHAAQQGDELFGVERVCQVLDAHAHRRAKDIMHALLDGVRAFADQPLDDVTVVVLKQLTTAPSGAETPAKSTPDPALGAKEPGFRGQSKA